MSAAGMSGGDCTKIAIIKSYDSMKSESGEKTKIVSQDNLPSISSSNSILDQNLKLEAHYYSICPSSRVKIRTGIILKLDKSFMLGFQRCMPINRVELSGDKLLDQAKNMASNLSIKNFEASNGFKKRYGIKFEKFHGDAGSVDQDV